MQVYKKLQIISIFAAYLLAVIYGYQGETTHSILFAILGGIWEVIFTLEKRNEHD